MLWGSDITLSCRDRVSHDPGVALGRLPLLRRTLRDKQLVTPFRKSIVSSRGYYLVRSTRAAGKKDVGEF